MLGSSENIFLQLPRLLRTVRDGLIPAGSCRAGHVSSALLRWAREKVEKIA